MTGTPASSGSGRRPGPLEIDRLALARGGRLLFQDLSARIAPGEAVALVGANGVGKSSLLRALAGLIPLAGGDVRYRGASLRADRTAFQAALAYGGHAEALKPAMTVAATVRFWRRYYGGAPESEARALAALDLTALAEAPVRVLSAGQRRRLALSRLLAAPRPLWLMDEPTTSLDARSAAAVAAMMGAHLAEGGIVVAATHLDLGLKSRRLDLEAAGAAPAPSPSSPSYAAALAAEAAYWLE